MPSTLIVRTTLAFCQESVVNKSTRFNDGMPEPRKPIVFPLILMYTGSPNDPVDVERLSKELSAHSSAADAKLNSRTFRTAVWQEHVLVVPACTRLCALASCKCPKECTRARTRRTGEKEERKTIARGPSGACVISLNYPDDFRRVQPPRVHPRAALPDESETKRIGALRPGPDRYSPGNVGASGNVAFFHRGSSCSCIVNCWKYCCRKRSVNRNIVSDADPGIGRIKRTRSY
jgi:hypothetical protein